VVAGTFSSAFVTPVGGIVVGGGIALLADWGLSATNKAWIRPANQHGVAPLQLALDRYAERMRNSSGPTPNWRKRERDPVYSGL
jgi:hypothetical protein